VSRPALGSTQPPVQWVPGVLSPELKRGRGVTLTTHPHLVPRSRMSRSYISSPQSAFMACSWTAFFYPYVINPDISRGTLLSLQSAFFKYSRINSRTCSPFSPLCLLRPVCSGVNDYELCEVASSPSSLRVVAVSTGEFLRKSYARDKHLSRWTRRYLMRPQVLYETH
jgi:hypothetical protein